MHYLLNLENFKIYIKIHTIMAPNISVYDHHQGACTEPGKSYIYVIALGKRTS